MEEKGQTKDGQKELNDVRIGMQSIVGKVIGYCSMLLTVKQLRTIRFTAVGGAIGKLINVVENLRIFNQGLYQSNVLSTVSYQAVDKQGKVMNERLHPKMEIHLSLDEPAEKHEGFQTKLNEDERKRLHDFMNARREQRQTEGPSRGGRGRGGFRGGRGQFRGGRGQFSGGRGQFRGGRGQFSGRRGQFGGDREQFGGDREQFGGDREQFEGEREQFRGGRGQFRGGRGKFGGGRGQFGSDRGRFEGDRGQFGAEREQFRGGREQFGAEREQFRGGREQFRGGRGHFGFEREQFRGGREQFRGGSGQFRGDAPRGARRF